MNEWFVAALVLITSIAPLGIAATRFGPVDRVVALQVAGTTSSLVLLLMAEGMHQDSFADLGLTAAFLTFAAGLTYARFLERWV
ncbi:MAG TPA: MrpF/PhaF family protein [Actinomycetota bacterium]|jgi:multisubunit Na+/H+ antiporter MnhF subunit|nr:MrpF/PhaF family protein [Actinomycetota bacterium]